MDIKDFIDGNGILSIPEEIAIEENGKATGVKYIATTIDKEIYQLNTHIIKEIRIPSTIREINWCFYHYNNLKTFQVDKNNQYYCDIDGVLYTKDHKILVAYPNKHAKEYFLPSGVDVIGKYAFKSCCDIESIECNNELTCIKINAFYECIHLKQVILNDKIEKIEGCTENANYHFTFKYKGKEYTLDEIQKLLANK